MVKKLKKEPEANKTTKQEAGIEGVDSYLAGGDIDITRREEAQKSGKRLEKVTKWLGIIVAITIIISFLFDLPKKIREALAPKSAMFYGVVIDETGQFVANAKIAIQEKEGDKVRIGFDKTRPNGEFSFVVKAKPEATIWVTVTKDGYIGFQGYKALLGNTTILFRRK